MHFKTKSHIKYIHPVFSSVLVLTFLFTSLSLAAQYDDLYYDPSYVGYYGGNEHLRSDDDAVSYDEDFPVETDTIYDITESIEFISEDELIEVTPEKIRMRKMELDANKRISAAKKNKE